MLVLDNLKERRPTKLINTRDISSNHVNAEVKVDGTITDNRIAREKEKSCAKVVKYGYDNTLRFANITDLSNTNYELLVCEKSNFSNSGTCAPVLHTNSVEVSNSSNLQISQNDANDFFSQDE